MHVSTGTATDDARFFDLFATPLHLPTQPWERQVVAEATRLDGVPHGDDILPVYAWGKGPAVVLVHGWGARAAHMGALARAVALAGFTAVAYDAPAHTPAAIAGTARRHATLVDFARALAAVCDVVGPVHGLIGHSMGGAACALTLSGFLHLVGDAGAHTATRVERLVLVSAPDRLANAVAAWAHLSGAGEPAVAGIHRETLRRFGVPIEAFSVSDHAARLPARTLLIHDDGDAEVPIGDAERVAAALGGDRLVTTTGLGHGRTLVDPDVAAQVVAHLQAR